MGLFVNKIFKLFKKIAKRSGAISAKKEICYHFLIAYCPERCYYLFMKARHRKTLQAIFQKPTSGTIVFSDIEALVVSLGGEVQEREGSRVKISLKGSQWYCHRPHPGKEARHYQVKEAREFLERVGVKP